MLKIAIVAILLTAVAVPTVLFATQTPQGTEARVNAYKHEDGKIEFAVQIKEGDEWGSRILPRGRFLTTSAPTGRWLSSTPVTVPSSVSALLPITTNSIYVLGENYDDLQFQAGRFSEFNDRFSTQVSISGVANVGSTYNPTLLLTCYAPYYDFNGAFGASVSIPRPKHPNIKVRLTAEKFKDYEQYGTVDLEERLRWEIDAEPGSSWMSQDQMLGIKGFHRLAVGYRDLEGNEIIVFFDIARALGTPVQPNLDYCGQYDY